MIFDSARDFVNRQQRVLGTMFAISWPFQDHAADMAVEPQPEPSQPSLCRFFLADEEDRCWYCGDDKLGHRQDVFSASGVKA